MAVGVGVAVLVEEEEEVVAAAGGETKGNPVVEVEAAAGAATSRHLSTAHLLPLKVASGATPTVSPASSSSPSASLVRLSTGASLLTSTTKSMRRSSEKYSS